MSERLYRIIDSKMFKSLSIKTSRDYKFEKYYNGGEKKQFALHEKSEGKDRCYSLDDTGSSDYWDKSLDDVFLNLKVQINNCNILFGSNGVACEDSVIGVGLIWHAENSRIKRCIKIGEITKDCSTKLFEKEKIKLNNLNSTINFTLIFYIKKPGHNLNDKSIGNESGLILGEYFFLCLVGEGKGSVFPICNAALDPEILWSFRCNYSDISEDDFSEDNILVILNSKHKLYKYYEINNIDYNSDMLNSLLSHILAILIMDIRNKEGGVINLNEEANKGSILSVLQYYNNVLNIKINSNFDELLESVQKFMYNGCKV